VSGPTRNSRLLAGGALLKATLPGIQRSRQGQRSHSLRVCVFHAAAHVLFVAALLFAGNAFAVPQCWPKPVGTGSYMTTSTGTTVHPDGEWAYWFCPDPYAISFVITARHKDTQFQTPNTDGMTVVQMLEAIWAANIDASLGDPRLTGLRDAAIAHLQTNKPPAPKWAVAKNGTTLTRPVYARNADGTLGPLVSGVRAPVGAECFVSSAALRVVSGSSTYGAIKLGEPVQVTLCKPVP
jgi:hypothetical protein